MQQFEQPDQEHPGQPSQSRPPRHRWGRWCVAALVLVTLGVALWVGSYALTPGPAGTEPDKVVFIPRGASVEQISSILDQAGLIQGDFRFVILTRLMQVSARLPAGEFRLKTSQTPVDLIRDLVDALPLQHPVTIPEGLNITEIAQIFGDGSWADTDRFIALTRDRQFIAGLGLPELASLEGYLYPDTYQLLKPPPTEEQLIRKLVNRALEVWGGLDQGKTALSRHQVFTLASIVEKETGRADERPLIAAVFLNRLAKNMKLQSDPTVIYGLDDFDGTLSRTDLKSDTAYNTYLINGLPPGPICSPGKDALQAVLSPAESNYYYFVSKNDGSHHFSTNLREHNRAVRKYQRQPAR